MTVKCNSCHAENVTVIGLRSLSGEPSQVIAGVLLTEHGIPIDRCLIGTGFREGVVYECVTHTAQARAGEEPIL